MKRIVLTGAALAALLTGGVTTAAVAATSHHGHATHVTTKRVTRTVYMRATCTLALTTVAPPNSTSVEAGSAQGVNYGMSRCPTPLRVGTARQTFSESAAGHLTGKLQQWFAAGTVYGTYHLSETVTAGPPTPTSFGSARFYGTVTITGASGALRGASGTGTMSCHTLDSVHYTCTERLHLHQSVTVVKTVS